MLVVSEECLEKIEEIQNDCVKYVKRHRQMPLSFGVTKRELALVKEARKAGIIPKVIFRGEEMPVTVKYGGFYG